MSLVSNPAQSRSAGALPCARSLAGWTFRPDYVRLQSSCDLTVIQPLVPSCRKRVYITEESRSFSVSSSSLALTLLKPGHTISFKPFPHPIIGHIKAGVGQTCGSSLVTSADMTSINHSSVLLTTQKFLSQISDSKFSALSLTSTWTLAYQPRLRRNNEQKLIN